MQRTVRLPLFPEEARRQLLIRASSFDAHQTSSGSTFARIDYYY